jgi:rubrerythrin
MNEQICYHCNELYVRSIFGDDKKVVKEKMRLIKVSWNRSYWVCLYCGGTMFASQARPPESCPYILEHTLDAQ